SREYPQHFLPIFSSNSALFYLPKTHSLVHLPLQASTIIMAFKNFSLSKLLLLLPLGVHLANAACSARLTAAPDQPEVVDNPNCPDGQFLDSQFIVPYLTLINLSDQGKAVIG